MEASWILEPAPILEDMRLLPAAPLKNQKAKSSKSHNKRSNEATSRIEARIPIPPILIPSPERPVRILPTSGPNDESLHLREAIPVIAQIGASPSSDQTRGDRPARSFEMDERGSRMARLAVEEGEERPWRDTWKERPGPFGVDISSEVQKGHQPSAVMAAGTEHYYDQI
ncbi:hypothetical protein KM043_005652 [Ampulex compressa]|nr:hypothetical protein KM043_005652 [Ampulex compressa]